MRSFVTTMTLWASLRPSVKKPRTEGWEWVPAPIKELKHLRILFTSVDKTEHKIDKWLGVVSVGVKRGSPWTGHSTPNPLWSFYTQLKWVFSTTCLGSALGTLSAERDHCRTSWPTCWKVASWGGLELDVSWTPSCGGFSWTSSWEGLYPISSGDTSGRADLKELLPLRPGYTWRKWMGGWMWDGLYINYRAHALHN